MDRQSQNTEMLRQFGLSGRVAFLSGATGHLGQSMAAALAGAGAHVVLNGRRREPLEALATDLRGDGHQVSVACFDITEDHAVGEHIGRIAAEYHRLDILVNNASAVRSGTLETATSEDFIQLYRVNVVAAFSLLQAALPMLRSAARNSRGGASVINIASMYGSVSPDPSIYGSSGANSPPCYGAAKGGLIQLTRYMACQLARDRIRVNCISPGPFPPAKYRAKDPDFGERLNAKVPMQRTGDPAEMQGPLLFLASDASSYVTGVNLAVDGGWTAW